MPRVPRIDFPGARHHVMNRGARRAPVLADDAARRIFVDALAELPDRFGVVVHAYALMPNHYHLMLGTPRGNLSRAMRHLGASFTQRLNRAGGWDGPVFRGRFKNRVAGDSRYWMHLLAYLHLNPVPALVSRPADWPWSSHRAYVGLEPPPDWLTTGELLDHFGSSESYAEYVEEHRTGRGTTPEGWDAEELWKPTRSAVMISQAPPPDTAPMLPTQALDEVARVTTRSLEQLTTARRGRGDNRARWLAAWWLGRRAGLTQREIAHRLDCSAGAVSQMVGRLRAAEDPEVTRWMVALDAIRRGSAHARGSDIEYRQS